MNATEAANTATPYQAVEFARALSPEAKQAVFLALLREAVEENGDSCLLPIEDESGAPFGYYLPPKAVAARASALLPKLSAEREAELARRHADPGKWLTAEELIESLNPVQTGQTPAPQ
jgi:hypothetical protein